MKQHTDSHPLKPKIFYSYYYLLQNYGCASSITNFTITVAAVDVTVDVVFANVKY